MWFLMFFKCFLLFLCFRFINKKTCFLLNIYQFYKTFLCGLRDALMQQSGREAAFLFSFKQLAMFFAKWFRPFSIVFFIFTATAAFSACGFIGFFTG